MAGFLEELLANVQGDVSMEQGDPEDDQAAAMRLQPVMGKQRVPTGAPINNDFGPIGAGDEFNLDGNNPVQRDPFPRPPVARPEATAAAAGSPLESVGAGVESLLRGFVPNLSVPEELTALPGQAIDALNAGPVNALQDAADRTGTAEDVGSMSADLPFVAQGADRARNLLRDATNSINTISNPETATTGELARNKLLEILVNSAKTAGSDALSQVGSTVKGGLDSLMQLFSGAETPPPQTKSEYFRNRQANEPVPYNVRSIPEAPSIQPPDLNPEMIERLRELKQQRNFGQNGLEF